MKMILHINENTISSKEGMEIFCKVSQEILKWHKSSAEEKDIIFSYIGNILYCRRNKKSISVYVYKER